MAIPMGKFYEIVALLHEHSAHKKKSSCKNCAFSCKNVYKMSFMLVL